MIPDSFKGSMSSLEICHITQEKILSYFPQCDVLSFPVADGGEGSVDSFLYALGGERIEVEVSGPYFTPTKSFYGIVNNDTAIIEMAACSGLPLVQDDLRPDETTTFGVGQLILDAAQRGCKKIIVGLGGSATNDGGVGAASAVGVRFYNSEEKEFIPTGKNLSAITRIDMSHKHPLLQEVEIIGMCDIDNPLFGKEGAAYVFAPQKGADEDLVVLLDEQLRALDHRIVTDLHKEVSQIAGSGAAGGLGAGMVAFFDASLQLGIDLVLDLLEFDSHLQDTDLVITGEGKLDISSVRGKVISGIAHRTKVQHIPLVAIVGDIGDEIDEIYDLGVTAVMSINRVAQDFSVVKKRAQSDLHLTVDTLMRLVKHIIIR